MKLKHLLENEVPEITRHWEAYNYAIKQGKRIPELEPIIMKDPHYAYYYAKEVIKGRWPEAESFLKKYPQTYNLYIREFPDIYTKTKTQPLMITLNDIIIIISDVPETISEEQCYKLFSLLFPDAPSVIIEELVNCQYLAHFDEDDTVYELTTQKLKDMGFVELYRLFGEDVYDIFDLPNSDFE